MSGIPSNMNALGSIMQAQVASNEKSKQGDAKVNQDTYAARQAAKVTEQQTEDVEDTEHVDGVVVRREDERERNGQDARDTWEQHKTEEDLYHQDSDQQLDDESSQDSADNSEDDSDDNQQGGHIDLSV